MTLSLEGRSHIWWASKRPTSAGKQCLLLLSPTPTLLPRGKRVGEAGVERGASPCTPPGEGRQHKGPARVLVGGDSSKTEGRGGLGPWHRPALREAAWRVVSMMGERAPPGPAEPPRSPLQGAASQNCWLSCSRPLSRRPQGCGLGGGSLLINRRCSYQRQRKPGSGFSPCSSAGSKCDSCCSS